jgi:uncharacterized BrkB/YihY/UPF0761 family membrane protein
LELHEGKQMLRIFRLIPETDELLQNAWRTRKWATFIRVWLLASVAMVPVTFVMTFILLYIPFLVYNVLISVAALIFGGTPTLVGPSLDVLFSTVAVPLAVMVGLLTLILTAPVMMLKQLSGEFK